MFFRDDQYFDSQLRLLDLTRELLAAKSADGHDAELFLSAPEKHSAVLPFTDFLIESCVPWATKMVTVTHWGAWPSSEHWSLYYALRKADGDAGELRERPCHVFLADESTKLRQYVYLFVLFSVDFSIVPIAPKNYLSVSNDGLVRIRRGDDQVELQALLSRWGFTEAE